MKAVRTLVDLLNNDHGYARIYADLEGYSYELITYVAKPIADLFERMAGYATVQEAASAAHQQLLAAHQVIRVRARRHRLTRQ